MRMSQENDGMIASSTIGDGGTSDKSTEPEKTVPYSRFKKMNDNYKADKQAWETRIAQLEAKVANWTATKSQEEEYEEISKLSPAEALKKMTAIAEEKAYQRIKNEQSKSHLESEKAQKLMDDGFDHLRDSGKTISASTEKELAKLAVDYKINIESPEDFEKIYDLYEAIQKTKGAGKSKDAETLGWLKDKTVSGKPVLDSRWSFSEMALASFNARNKAQ